MSAWGMVVHSCNLSTQEAEAGGSQVQSQPGIHRETVKKEGKTEGEREKTRRKRKKERKKEEEESEREEEESEREGEEREEGKEKERKELQFYSFL
jgi:hypothetical protein